MTIQRALRIIRTTVLITVVSFAAAELALRLIHHVRPSYVFFDASYERFRGRPHSMYRGTPLNSLGFKDLEFEVEPGDRYRIVALGDSFAFGIVPYEDVFLTRLEERLRIRGRAVEIFNMGIPQTGPPDYLALLLKEGLKYRPDHVLVIVYMGNDLLESGREQHRHRSLVDSSFVLALLRYAFVVSRNVEPGQIYGRRPYRDDQPTMRRETYLELLSRRCRVFQRSWAPLRSLVDGTMDALIGIAEASERAGARLTVVLAPDEIQIDPDLQRAVAAAYPEFDPHVMAYDQPNQLLTARLRDSGIDVLDLLEGFRAESRQRRLYKPQDTHWNIAGNRLAAELIARHLEKRD